MKTPVVPAAKITHP